MKFIQSSCAQCYSGSNQWASLVADQATPTTSLATRSALNLVVSSVSSMPFCACALPVQLKTVLLALKVLLYPLCSIGCIDSDIAIDRSMLTPSCEQRFAPDVRLLACLLVIGVVGGGSHDWQFRHPSAHLQPRAFQSASTGSYTRETMLSVRSN